MIFGLFYFILFVVFCLVGSLLLVGPLRTVAHPINNNFKIPVTGAQQFLYFTLLTGMLMFGYERFLVNLSAIRLFWWIILLIIGIVFMTKSKIIPSFVLAFYVCYLIWIAFMSVQSPEKGFAIRNFLKYLFPFLIMLFAMKAQVYELLFLKYIKQLVTVSLVLLGIIFIRPLYEEISKLFWGIAAFADYFSVIALMCLILFDLTREKKYLFFFSLFCSYSFFYTIRTGIFALTIGLAFYFFIKFRLKAIPFIVVLGIAIVALIIYVPNVREKMFKEKKLTTEQILENETYLSSDKIDTNARQAMWDWSMTKFYKGKELTGSGLGVLQAAFYSGKHPFGKLKMVHNDYVQILCDTGLIGVILFIGAFIAMVWHCVLIYHNKLNSRIVKYAALLSGASIAAIMTCSITDNAINYSLTTYCYPYAFYGITLILEKRNYDKRSHPLIQQRKADQIDT